MDATKGKDRFVRDIADPVVEDAQSYGGKASGLARMAKLGVPVPPAFVIGTNAYHHFRAAGGRLGDDLLTEVRDGLGRLERASERTFGGVERPLLVSVRSGAAISMPGMMDTVLNLGLTARSAFALARSRGTPDFALDTWMRFWRMYFDTVLGIDPSGLIDAVGEAERRARAAPSLQLFEALEGSIARHLAASGEAENCDPLELLTKTIAAVFRSWDSARATAYRRHHGISDAMGTAVTVQAMVFGNADGDSGSGVAFTRNPNDGARTLYGEYLIGRQGEDLVSGTHTPIDLSDPKAMKKDLRDALITIGEKLEAAYRDAVDIEFTVESGRLFLLQVRPAKRTAAAAVRIAEDLLAEGLIGPSVALTRISIEQLKKVSRPDFEEADLAAAKLIAQGLGSSPGHAHGAAVLDSDRAAERGGRGEAVILVRPTTSPQDIRGMLAANGIVTVTGGALSHAAVVSRALDKPCIVGCETIAIDLKARTFSAGGFRYCEGDEISVDGATGRVFAGALRIRPAGSGGATLNRVLSWADEMSGSEVWPAPHSAQELKAAPQHNLPALGVVRLTDLIISSGGIERFVELVGVIGKENPPASSSDAISDIVRTACLPLLAKALGLPVHIRISRVSSDRARKLIEDWTEMPPNLFLPLGSPAYLRSILAGLSAAAREARHDSVTALIGGIVDGNEFDNFRRETVRVGFLLAGAMIQNLAALHGAHHLARRGDTLWIDISEAIRTAYGFPTEVQQANKTLDDYVATGNLAGNPFRRPGELLTDLLSSTLSAARSAPTNAVGVDCTGCYAPDLLVDLHRLGFRRYAAPNAHRDEIRLLLAQRHER